MNALSFGLRVLDAANTPVNNWNVRGIAIAVVTFAVILHGIWRQAGLYLNNAFAMIKILILVLFIITGLISWGGGFHPNSLRKNHTVTSSNFIVYTNITNSNSSLENPAVAPSNLNVHNAFKDIAKGSYGFVEAFLAVVFAYGGFNQANYE